MARTWREYRSAIPTPDPCDNSDISDKIGPSEPQTGAIVPIVSFVTALPADIQRGLELLSNGPAPRLRHAEYWPSVVADALRLATEGWALKALKLGWNELDLFGAVPEKLGDPAADGLAAKLAGRPILALCASFATVEDGPNKRSFIYRGSNEGAVLLWELNNVRHYSSQRKVTKK